MTMQNPDRLVTKSDLHDYHESILPYLNGGGSGGGGHTIEDSTGTALTQRDVMQFSDSFAPTDDSTNEVTKIELNKLTSGEMDDIVTPLPSVQSRYHKYSTDEHIVGEWIDGSYIYEKTINIGNLPNNTSQSTSHNISNIDTIINYWGVAINDGLSLKFPAPSSTVDHTGDIGMHVDRTEYQIRTYRDRSAYVGYLTIQYTKST